MLSAELLITQHSTLADRREEWVGAQVREEADVLLCNPRLVQTGLDLVDVRRQQVGGLFAPDAGLPSGS